MKNDHENEMEALSALARVRPGEPGGDPAAPGALALLTSITGSADGPVTGTRRARHMRRARGFRLRRVAIGLAAVTGLAAAVVIGPSLLRDGTGLNPSYAVSKDSDGVVYVTVHEFGDAEGLRRQLRSLNVPATVDYTPPGKKCREPRGEHVERIPPGLYSVPQEIPGDERREGWQMRIDTKLFEPGQTFVWTIGERSTSTILMSGPVSPCVLVPDDSIGRVETDPPYRVATTKGRSLAGFRVDEKTVGEVLPELRRRGLKTEYLIMAIPPGNPGGFGELRVQDEPVGDEWVVWEAEESVRTPGLIRLLVTERRYDKNPVYGGPRDAIIPE
ncbi:hypothetical protein DP939_34190 [Spongiactinospora rosea]|uniref:Uncharacterized protein n=1 Tax=Spongiactinospora rosea TaxID=2248750 RepID=A0A366LQZ6_9ACTN|nr:hypothetical protein [Spongiactinospora rosea]RBQ15734.1 hypothetical protein DP939_34190 [Spongiactinospora rosea]